MKEGAKQVSYGSGDVLYDQFLHADRREVRRCVSLHRIVMKSRLLALVKLGQPANSSTTAFSLASKHRLVPVARAFDQNDGPPASLYCLVFIVPD